MYKKTKTNKKCNMRLCYCTCRLMMDRVYDLTRATAALSHSYPEAWDKQGHIKLIIVIKKIQASAFSLQIQIWKTSVFLWRLAGNALYGMYAYWAQLQELIFIKAKTLNHKIKGWQTVVPVFPIMKWEKKNTSAVAPHQLQFIII